MVVGAVPTHDVDALQREAWHKGWRKYLLCFQSNELEREFLELHAGKHSLLYLFSAQQPSKSMCRLHNFPDPQQHCFWSSMWVTWHVLQC